GRACAVHAPASGSVTVPLHVTGDEHAVIRATTRSKDAFARCIADRLAIRAHGAMRGTPRPFTFDMQLTARTPQLQFGWAADHIDYDRRCAAGPGALVRDLTVAADTGLEGLVVRVTTRPQNEAVDACVGDYTRNILDGLSQIADLHTQHHEVIPVMITSA